MDSYDAASDIRIQRYTAGYSISSKIILNSRFPMGRGVKDDKP
jgi:hypothetical protein